jgi:hypothetical protein
VSDEDTHHSSLTRNPNPGKFPVRPSEEDDRFDPYWNIEVCTQCGGSGQEPSGVEYMGISEMVGCESCYGIGYTNEEIQRLIDILTEGGL